VRFKFSFLKIVWKRAGRDWDFITEFCFGILRERRKHAFCFLLARSKSVKFYSRAAEMVVRYRVKLMLSNLAAVKWRCGLSVNFIITP